MVLFHLQGPSISEWDLAIRKECWTVRRLLIDTVGSFADSGTLITKHRTFYFFVNSFPSYNVLSWSENEKECKVYPRKATKVQRRSRDTTVLFYLDAGLGWVVYDMTRPLYPPERDPAPLCRRLGGPQDQSGRVWKIWPYWHWIPEVSSP